MRQRVMIAMALLVRARAADRRRADDRARRDRAGADPRAAARAAARLRHGDRADHARPRRRRGALRRGHGDVRRPRHGAARRRRTCSRGRASRTRSACWRAVPRLDQNGASVAAIPGWSAEHGAAAGGLPVQRALRSRDARCARDAACCSSRRAASAPSCAPAIARLSR